MVLLVSKFAKAHQVTIVDKKIIVRLQKIPEKIMSEQAGGAGTYAFSVAPEEENIRSLRGNLYGNLEISISSDFPAKGGPDSGWDTALAEKVALDVLEGSYYSNLDGPPLPALEEAVLKTKEKLQFLSQEKLAEIDFNLVVCALWGKVLYLVKFGDGNFYLLRGGNIKEILEGTRSDVAVASGIIEEGDAAILTSSRFSQHFKKESLIKNLDSLEESIKKLPDSNLLSALILKFETEAITTKTDLLKISMPKVDIKQGKKVFESWRSISKLSKNVFKKLGKIVSIKDKDSIYVSSPKTYASPQAGKVSNLGKAVFILGVLLVTSVVFTISKQRKENVSKVVSEVMDLSNQNISQSKNLLDLNNAKARDLLNTAKSEIINLKGLGIENEELTKKLNEINDLLDRVNRVRKVDPIPFFELDSGRERNILGSVIFENELYLLESKEGKLYIVSISGGEGAASSSDLNFSNLVSLASLEDNIVVGAKEGAYFFNRGDQKAGGFSKEFDIDEEDSSFNSMNTYFGNIYILVPKRNQIVKYTPAGGSPAGGFTKSDWLKKTEDIADSVSFTIDGDIYVLKNDGNIIKFSQGEREDFSILNLDEQFLEPIFIYTNPELQFLYILDKGAKKVGVISKDGYYNSQIKLDGDPSTGSGDWSKLSSMAVDVDSGFLYITSDRKVWKVSME